MPSMCSIFCAAVPSQTALQNANGYTGHFLAIPPVRLACRCLAAPPRIAPQLGTPYRASVVLALDHAAEAGASCQLPPRGVGSSKRPGAQRREAGPELDLAARGIGLATVGTSRLEHVLRSRFSTSGALDMSLVLLRAYASPSSSRTCIP